MPAEPNTRGFTGEKAVLHRYLQVGRDVLMWKLDGLSDVDIRRPLTPTGTNLLGLVKHVASIEIEYFTTVFGRPCPAALPWFAPGAEPNADMWAAPNESRQSIVDLYRLSWATSDATIAECSLDHPGEVPWWSEPARLTDLRTVIVHMIAETHRHAGHADIIRELNDGAIGWNSTSPNLPDLDATGWASHRERIDHAARATAVSTEP